jgi:hypothetical protein
MDDRKASTLPPGGIQECHTFHLDSCLAQLRRNVHALDHIDGGATHIDGATARAKRAAALNDSYGMPAPRQPVRKCAPGNSCTRDQDLKSCHDKPDVDGRSLGTVFV